MRSDWKWALPGPAETHTDPTSVMTIKGRRPKPVPVGNDELNLQRRGFCRGNTRVISMVGARRGRGREGTPAALVLFSHPVASVFSNTRALPGEYRRAEKKEPNCPRFRLSEKSSALRRS